jgi:GR25 family glycosyltransferase involved in LPS biosynthesis
MKSFIINLPFRQDRLDKINYNLIKNYTIFEAIYFSNLSHETKNTYKERFCTVDNKIDSDGAMGCFISHYEVLNLICKQSEYEYAYVFEDDVKIIYEELFLNVESNLPQNFDVLMLGGFYGKNYDTNDGFYTPIYNNYCACTEAYIVSKKGAKKIIDLIDNKKYTSQNIDWYYHNLGKNNEIEYYCHHPMITTQDHNDSNIKK